MIRKLLLGLLLALWGAGAQGAVTLDAAGAVSFNFSGTTGTNSNQTVGSNSGEVLLATLVFATNVANGPPTGVTVTWDAAGANQAMTLIKSQTSGSPNNELVTSQLWGLINPVAGNKVLSAAWTATQDLYLASVALKGANQGGGTATFANSTSATGTGGSPRSNTITSETGSMTVGVFGLDFHGGAPTTNQTQLFSSSGIGNGSGGGDYATASGNITDTWTFSNDGTQPVWAWVGVDVKATAATTQMLTLIGASQGSPAPSGPPSNLPNIIEGYWYWGFSEPTIATVRTNAPKANYATWFTVVGTGSGGTVTLAGVGVPNVTDIANWKAAGKAFGLDIGGSASDVGQPSQLTLNNASDLAQMKSSLTAIIDANGFQGIGWDMENDVGQWDPTQACALFSFLKAKYGSAFFVDIQPAPYQIRDLTTYPFGQLYALCPSNIDLISPQWYSQCGQTDAWFINVYITPDLTTFTGLGIPAAKILIGAADNDGGNCGAPSGPATYCTAFTNWNAANPTKVLRGLKWFHTNSDEHLGAPEGGAWHYGGSVAPACLGL